MGTCCLYSFKDAISNQAGKEHPHPIVGIHFRVLPSRPLLQNGPARERARFLGKFHFLCTPVGEVTAENHVIFFLPLCSVMRLSPVLVSSGIFVWLGKGKHTHTHTVHYLKLKSKIKTKLRRQMFCPILLRDSCSLTPEELGSADTILCSSWQSLGDTFFFIFFSTYAQE